MGNNKKQGGSYEREIASKLSLWYTKEERDDIFYRSHSSGGRATNRKKAGKELEGQHGDICATDSIGKPLIDVWVGECKHGYGKRTDIKALGKKQIRVQWCVLDILDSTQKVGVLIELWRLAKREASAAGNDKVPILFVQRDRRASLIIMPEKEFGIWVKLFKEIPPTYVKVKRPRFVGLIIMNLDEFFTWTKSNPTKRFKKGGVNG